MFSDCRVVDLTDGHALFCGYLLAHVGADVVLVEPPGGAAARRMAPLPADGGDGLWWQAYARGRRVLRLSDNARDRARRDALIDGADVLIASGTPASLARDGLVYAALATRNPGLVMVAITPFGMDGPKADWPATDLTVWAAGGAHVLAGDADRAPVRTSVPQAFLHCAADAAGAALLALHERHRSGLGQLVDASAQQSSAQAALGASLGAPNHSSIVVRRVAGGLAAGFPVRMTWPCSDSHVAITLLFGPAFTEPNRRFLRWVHESGHLSAADAEKDWGLALAAMINAGEAPAPYFELCEKIEAFTRERSAAELFEEGLARGCYIAPTLDVAGVLQERHFIERDFWVPMAPDDRRRVPGPFAKLSASPLTIPSPPRDDPQAAFAPRATPRPAAVPRDDTRPLDGLKVLDFMWVIAGPLCTRALSDYGATVIRVESTARMDAARASPPFRDDQLDLELGAPFQNFNAGKLGVTIDPANPEGRRVIRDLVRWADVVSESFSPRAMRSWGLDHDSLKAINPSIIMLSSCLMGQTGPRAMVPGYGNMAAALTGYYDLTGWPDRSPAGPYLAYTDGVAPRFMLIALLAALEHRRRTGEGQHIDLSQAEAALHLLAPALLDVDTSGRVWTRMGNSDLDLCPHAVYPAAGDDQWVAVACQDDAAWPRLCGVVGMDAMLRGLADAPQRRRHEADIDAAIAAWTSSRTPAEVESALVSAGVAVHGVQNTVECMDDPQLAARGHFLTVPHSGGGEVVVEAPRCRLSRTPARTGRGAPALGEHNAQVLQQILGYDDERLAEVFASLAMQ